jgi:hypothetical protein
MEDMTERVIVSAVRIAIGNFGSPAAYQRRIGALLAMAAVHAQASFLDR